MPPATRPEDRRGERHGKRRTRLRQVGIRKTVRSPEFVGIAVDVSLLVLGDIKTKADQECLGRSPADGR